MILKKEEMLHNSSGNMSSLGSSGAFASLGILLDGLLGDWFFGGCSLAIMMSCLGSQIMIAHWILFAFLDFFLSFILNGLMVS